MEGRGSGRAPPLVCAQQSDTIDPEAIDPVWEEIMTLLTPSLPRSLSEVPFGGSRAERTGWGRVLIGRRPLCLALGFLWLFDGALQLQSYMFTTGFARQVIAPAASGQPPIVAGLVRWNAHLIAGNPVVCNALFATVQLALGVGFLFRRSAPWAVVCSTVWASGVWLFGEGFGGLFGGRTTALVGAPGAAVLYVVLSLAAWPGAPPETDGGDRRPAGWVLRAWAALWLGFAALGMLPANLASSSVSAQLRLNAAGAPSWLALVDRGAASAVHRLGPGAVALVVTVEGAIGLLSLSQGKVRPVAVWCGIALAGVFWLVGQSCGLIFSGQATDPNSGPLVILLGLAAAGATRPADARMARHGGVNRFGKLVAPRMARDAYS
jgi:hypothetical protein